MGLIDVLGYACGPRGFKLGRAHACPSATARWVFDTLNEMTTIDRLGRGRGQGPGIINHPRVAMEEERPKAPSFFLVRIAPYLPLARCTLSTQVLCTMLLLVVSQSTWC